MDCKRVRLAISAELDGEATDVADELVAAHVARCPDCRSWQGAALDVTRRVRVSSLTPPPDVFERILAATGQRRNLGISRVRAMLLVLCAAGQLAVSISTFPSSNGGMAGHESHEVAVFGCALAAAFALAAIRPRLAAGLAWICGITALGLLATAFADIVSHRTFGAHEMRHLVAVLGAVLVCWVAAEHRTPRPGPAAFARDRKNVPGARVLWRQQRDDAA
jgi:predicted anti-sigma-YlaC factor YlaD